jgi:hypothetical protein
LHLTSIIQQLKNALDEQMSAKNHVRRSVSWIQFSIKLPVATSLCWSQISFVARKERVSCWLSSQSSPDHLLSAYPVSIVDFWPLISCDI